MEMLPPRPGAGNRSAESLPETPGNFPCKLETISSMKFQVFGRWKKIQGVKFLRAALNYRKELFQICCEINAAGRERHAVFHYRVESENPYLSFFPCRQLTPNFCCRGLLAGWVGLCHCKSGRQHRQHYDKR